MPQYSALIDAKSSAVLIASTHISAIVFLNEHTPDTVHWPLVHSPNYEQWFPLANLPTDEYPLWQWNAGARLFDKTTATDVVQLLIPRARLVAAKFTAIIKIMNNLNTTRYTQRTGLEFQETVYLLKRLEAERFIASGYDESRSAEFPLVAQYADFAGCSLKTAADDILFRARLSEDQLAKSELLRMKYFKLVGAADETTLPQILRQFYTDCYGNTLIS